VSQNVQAALQAYPTVTRLFFSREE